MKIKSLTAIQMELDALQKRAAETYRHMDADLITVREAREAMGDIQAQIREVEKAKELSGAYLQPGELVIRPMTKAERAHRLHQKAKEEFLAERRYFLDTAEAEKPHRAHGTRQGIWKWKIEGERGAGMPGARKYGRWVCHSCNRPKGGTHHADCTAEQPQGRKARVRCSKCGYQGHQDIGGPIHCPQCGHQGDVRPGAILCPKSKTRGGYRMIAGQAVKCSCKAPAPSHLTVAHSEKCDVYRAGILELERQQGTVIGWRYEERKGRWGRFRRRFEVERRDALSGLDLTGGATDQYCPARKAGDSCESGDVECEFHGTTYCEEHGWCEPCAAAAADPESEELKRKLDTPLPEVDNVTDEVIADIDSQLVLWPGVERWQYEQLFEPPLHWRRPLPVPPARGTLSATWIGSEFEEYPPIGDWIELPETAEQNYRRLTEERRAKRKAEQEQRKPITVPGGRDPNAENECLSFGHVPIVGTDRCLRCGLTTREQELLRAKFLDTQPEGW